MAIRIKRKDVASVKARRTEKDIRSSEYAKSVSPETQEPSMKALHYRNKPLEL